MLGSIFGLAFVQQVVDRLVVDFQHGRGEGIFPPAQCYIIISNSGSISKGSGSSEVVVVAMMLVVVVVNH